MPFLHRPQRKKGAISYNPILRVHVRINEIWKECLPHRAVVGIQWDNTKVLSKCLWNEWRPDSCPEPKTLSPVPFPLCILPVTAHSAQAAAPTGQQDRPAGRWPPKAHLLHSLSAPGHPALQSSPSAATEDPALTTLESPPLLASIATGGSLVASPPLWRTALRTPHLQSRIPVLARS